MARRPRRALAGERGWPSCRSQLALADHASFDTFVSGSNAAAVEHVRNLAQGGADTVWLWGAEGAGKSHLLQAACRAATEAGRRAMYVPLPAVSPAILADLEHVDLLAVDDVHTVAGDLALGTAAVRDPQCLPRAQRRAAARGRGAGRAMRISSSPISRRAARAP